MWIGQAKDFNLVHIKIMKSQKLICFHPVSIRFYFLSPPLKILSSIPSSIKTEIILHTHLYNELGVIQIHKILIGSISVSDFLQSSTCNFGYHD